ncbi:hypothetical protein KC323_g9100 [Hortaea werneckii]|nr:hypothetical protein KC323_g9100 [Hortaea werneckii]
MAWNTVPGAIRALGEAIGILNYLQRKTIIFGERLFEQIVIQEDARHYQPVQAGRKRTKQQIISLLQAAGAQNIDGRFGIERRVQRDNSTSVCDRCYSVNQMKKKTPRFNCIGTHTIQKCQPANGINNQCQACYNHGVPCTWSGREIYVEAPPQDTVRFLQAIWFPAALPEAAVSMGSRNLNFGQPNEPTPTTESEGVVQQAPGTPGHQRRTSYPTVAPVAGPSSRHGSSQQPPSGTSGHPRRTSFPTGAPVAGPSSRHGSSQQPPSGTSGHQKFVSFPATAPMAGPSSRHGSSQQPPSGTSGNQKHIPFPSSTSMPMLPVAGPASRSGQRPVSAEVSGYGSGQQPPSGPSGHQKSISIDMSKVRAPAPASGPGQRPASGSSQALVAQGQTNLPPVQAFNANNIDNLLNRGRREDITAAARSVADHASRNHNLATFAGARAARYVNRVRTAAQEWQDGSDPMGQDYEWFGGLVRGLNSSMISLTDTFTFSNFVDEDGRPISNRPPTSEEVQLYINRMAVGNHHQAFLTQLSDFYSNLGAALSRNMQLQLFVISNAMTSPSRPPFAQPQQRMDFRQVHLLPRGDAYTGPVRPTVPGSVPYVFNSQGESVSSHHVITQTQLRNTLATYVTRANEGSDTTQVAYNIRTDFRRVRNLYHMTASPHLLVIADHIAQVYESVSGTNLWNTFPDDQPSNMFD